jgi:hypothetical protein
LGVQGNTYAKVAMGLMTIRFETPWGAFSSVPPLSSNLEHQRHFRVSRSTRILHSSTRHVANYVIRGVNYHFILYWFFMQIFHFPAHQRYADFWCDGCKNHVAKGVRFNAEKKAIGAYFSTKIWQFSMTCHRCSHPLVFVTEPQVLLLHDNANHQHQ